MASADSNFDLDVLPVAKSYARTYFAGQQQIEDLVCDTVSVAWQMWRRAPHAPPISLAWYAVKRVACGRQFDQSIRSIDGPNPMKWERPIRADSDLLVWITIDDDPAEIAIVTVDGANFRASLSKRDRKIFDCLLMGDKAMEIAKYFGVSEGLISQRRRAMVEAWHEFTA